MRLICSRSSARYARNCLLCTVACSTNMEGEVELTRLDRELASSTSFFHLLELRVRQIVRVIVSYSSYMYHVLSASLCRSSTLQNLLHR